MDIFEHQQIELLANIKTKPFLAYVASINTKKSDNNRLLIVFPSYTSL